MDGTSEGGPTVADTDLIARVAEKFRARGERMTGPRRTVLLALGAQPGHLSVEQVYEAVAGIDDSVNRSSVYRALDALCRLGVVQHIHLGHGATAYHLADPLGKHPHAQCSRCGTVWDLPMDVLDEVASRLSTFGFTLDATHVALSGLCAGCRQARAAVAASGSEPGEALSTATLLQ